MTRWLEVARKYEGLAEVTGKGSNPIILHWLQIEGKGKSWVKDDATAWCGATMAGVFTEADMVDIIPDEPLRARAWAEVGQKLDGPRVGAIVVFPRPPNPESGHVGLIVEVGSDHIKVLGGNQRNKETGRDEVCVARFALHGTMKPIAYRWPLKMKTPSEMEAESRIAAAAARQQKDAIKGTTTGTSSQLPLAVPDKSLIDGLLGNLGWFKNTASTLADFGVFGVKQWPWIALAIGVYFGARMIWDSHLIKKFRTEDHNLGYTST